MLDIDPNIILRYAIVAYRYSILGIDIVVFLVRAIFEYVRLAYRYFIPRSQRSITGHVALVTGAGHGIGKAIAIQLAQHGCIVVCLDINKEINDETVQTIIQNGGKGYGYTCDVSSVVSVDDTIRQVQEEIGDIDILINNAGVLTCRPFVQHSTNDIEKIISTNLLGQLWVLRAVLPRMIARNKGSIVAMTSLAGHAGAPNMVPYTASKFGIRGMMEALYIELRQENPYHNVHLMTVSPFIIDTGMVKSPRIRFPGLLDVVTADEAADIIITNMRRRAAIVFIPNILYYLQCVVRILPSRIQLLLTDFIDTGIGVDYDSD